MVDLKVIFTRPVFLFSMDCFFVGEKSSPESIEGQVRSLIPMGGDLHVCEKSASVKLISLPISQIPWRFPMGFSFHGWFISIANLSYPANKYFFCW